MKADKLDKSKIMITQHAIKKYYEVVGNVDDLEKEIRLLFEQSKIESFNAGILKRIMKNEFEDAKYYKYGIWRFVICGNTMVTMEKDKFKDTTLGYIKKKSLINGRRRNRK